MSHNFAPSPPKGGHDTGFRCHFHVMFCICQLVRGDRPIATQLQQPGATDER